MKDNIQLYNSIVARLMNPFAFMIGDFIKDFILLLPPRVHKETVHMRMEMLKENKKENIDNDQYLSENDKQVQKSFLDFVFPNAEKALIQQLSIDGRLFNNSL